MSFGKYTYGKPITHWDSENAKLVVGNFCSIAGNVNIYLGGNHRTDWISTYPFGHIHKDVFNTFDGTGHPTTNGDIQIGNDFWIGMSVKIMSGVKIGDGAVIGAHSLVTKNVEPYTIVGGNPAKIIRKRFSCEVIDLLLTLKWWEWDDNKINENIHILCSNDFDKIKKI
jgi:acetyltransferase-like isoleucine patch superfamily enzyme